MSYFNRIVMYGGIVTHLSLHDLQERIEGVKDMAFIDLIM